jgi:hypothetical protein
MIKIIFQFIAAILSLIFMGLGLLLVGTGLYDTLEIIKEYNSELYTAIVIIIFGLCSFYIGKNVISEITSQKKTIEK